jgi:D-beta-D-heptose 7-phosphate kinase/D-beta-D-heptose 1-phosphate adenosyltransferase
MHGILERFDQARVAVLGDLMLDLYLTGSVDRISPEAPVPVMLVNRDSAAPGGAANVAANLASLQIPVRLVGASGSDTEREQLLGALAAMGPVDCSGVVPVPDWRTITKLRIIGAHQQLLRIDREEILSLSQLTEDALIFAACNAIDQSDLLIISDYGKGTCSDRVLHDVIRHARQTGRPVLVDPKRVDFSAYRGASLIKPNRKELAAATGMPCETDEEVARAAAAAYRTCGADIVLTRSEKGLSYLPGDGPALHLPTLAREVFDVSGAGDTVIAVLAAGLAVGYPMDEALRLANHAAGIVVSKLGTATVTRSELASVGGGEDAAHCEGGLVDLPAAMALRKRWAEEGLKVGFTNGCFDLLHPGHVALLRQAAAECDRLIVALNTDASVRRLKGPSRPIQREDARAKVIGAIRDVAAVILFDQDTPRACIEALRPDLLVKGADYEIDAVVGADIVMGHGGQVLLVQLNEAHSTTMLVDRANAE